MRMLKRFGVKALVLALSLAMMPVAVPFDTPLVGATVAKADPDFYVVGDFGHRRFHRHRYYDSPRYYHRRHYRHYPRRHYRDDDDGAAAVLGAIIGLGVGAAIASQAQPRVLYRTAPRYYGAPEPWTRAWYFYCADRYRSFDARSGTFQPYYGPRRLCR